LAAIAAGCGGGGAGDGTLSVYVSVPLQGDRGAEGRAIVDGARQALRAAGGRAGEHEVRAVYLDDSGESGGWSPVRTAANARRAAEDSRTIGYIGELDSGATRVSLPITNQAGIVQISPGATAVDLTRDSPAGSPERYRPNGDRNFARLVPDDEVQARAAASLAERLGARTVAVVRAGSAFSEVLVDAFTDQMPALGLQGTEAAGGDYDVVYYAGAEEGGFRSSALAKPSVEVIASDAVRPNVTRICRDLLAPLYVTSPYAPTSARFEARPAAAYGYEAMSLLLDAIRRGGGDRGDVIDEVLATGDRDSPIGRYSIDGFGDATLDRIGVASVRNCELRSEVPIVAPP
jgi:branched-chain amino acid transport system substrate-binding protein